MAPENSQIEAIMTVCFIVSAFAPTDVAKEFATSLPPISHPETLFALPIPMEAINARTAHVIGIHADPVRAIADKYEPEKESSLNEWIGPFFNCVPN